MRYLLSRKGGVLFQFANAGEKEVIWKPMQVFFTCINAWLLGELQVGTPAMAAGGVPAGRVAAMAKR